jgi:hypothetical protein
MSLPKRDISAFFFSCRFHQVELVQVKYCTEEILSTISRLELRQDRIARVGHVRRKRLCFGKILPVWKEKSWKI